MTLKILKTLFILLVTNFTFGQTPIGLIENKTRVFYKDVLNEFNLKIFSNGRVSFNTDNGELVYQNNKHYIKPTKLGTIIIKIKEIKSDTTKGTKTEIQLYEYFECVELVKPSIQFITSKKDTLNFSNNISKNQIDSINSIVPLNLSKDVEANIKLSKLNILIITSKGKVLEKEVEPNDITNLFKQTKIGDKICFVNMKAKVDDLQNFIYLDNKIVQVVE